MRESGLGGLSWAISLFLIVILVGFMSGTVAGEASQPQPDIGFSEPLTVSGPEGSDTTQQDGTIEMDHAQVVVRASKTQVTPGERVQITYDGVAFPGNPEPLNFQIIATIPSGVTASDMRAEGCGPQCPITDQQLRPSDKLSAGSFTITPQESGDYDIDIRATYTFANGSTRSWSETTRITISAEPEPTPAPEPGIDEKITNKLEDSNTIFITLPLIGILFVSIITFIRHSDLELSKTRTEWNLFDAVLTIINVFSILIAIDGLIENFTKIGRSDVLYSLSLSFVLILFANLYIFLFSNILEKTENNIIKIVGGLGFFPFLFAVFDLITNPMFDIGLINSLSAIVLTFFSVMFVGSLLLIFWIIGDIHGYYIDNFSLTLQSTILFQLLSILCHLAIYNFYIQFFA